MVNNFTYIGSKITVRPSHLIHIPEKVYLEEKKRISNRHKFKSNTTKGKLSKESSKKLKTAINWLVKSAKYKKCYSKMTGKEFRYKCNLITLDLPTLNHNITDNYFKENMLHNWLNTAKYKCSLKNYVWKVETQGNGNIHAHITSDCFAHWRDVRESWNKILEKEKLVSQYRDRFECMSFDEYVSLFKGNDLYNYEKIKAAFEYGIRTKWSNPNTTDVKAIRNINNLGAYLCKYMAKNSNKKKPRDKKISYTKTKAFRSYNTGILNYTNVYEKIDSFASGEIKSVRRKISGRLWGCNYSLSKAYGMKLESNAIEPREYIDENCFSDFKIKDIKIKDKFGQEGPVIGNLILVKDNQWDKFDPRITNFYHSIRDSIKNNSRVTGNLFCID